MDKPVNITLGKLIGAFLSLGVYTTIVCIFFYNLNTSSTKEWRDEHSKQIEKNESHWREMFTHFNSRLDRMTEK